MKCPAEDGAPHTAVRKAFPNLTASYAAYAASHTPDAGDRLLEVSGKAAATLY